MAKKYSSNRFSLYNRELDEIVVTNDDIDEDIDLNEKESKKIIDISKLIKRSGDYSYYFLKEGFSDIYIYVYDISSKIIVGIFSFEMSGNDFHVLYPLIKKEWRGKGIGSEVYKILLTKGNIVSGGEQTKSAIGLWRKLISSINNKVIYFDGKN